MVHNTVIRVDPAALESIRRHLLSAPGVRELRPTNKYEAFRLSHAGGTIVAYISGKIVSNTPDATRLLQEAVRSTRTARPGVVIGSDEAGKGEWLGPLVVAAVALESSQAIALQSLGVMDSKDVPLTRIPTLADQVVENSLGHEVVVIPPATFEQRLREFRQEGKNLNDLLAWAHSRAIGNLLRRISPESPIMVVVDEFARAKTQERLARLIDLSVITLVQRPHAEDEIAVAAASIIARHRREKWIDAAANRLGLALRSLTPDEAARHPLAQEFAKTSYLSGRG